MGNPRCVRFFHLRSAKRSQPRGFVLIVTITMLMILVLLAVGLLTLSTVTLRAGGRVQAAVQARANARMSLMLALGELQKNAGPDTRVTAQANILDENNPPVMGVWKSWEGTDHTTSGNFIGRPISPGTYQSKKKDRFLGWMVSQAKKSTDVPDLSGATGSVALVGEHTVGAGQGRDKMQVRVQPVEMQESIGKGAYAWWIGGENQKARVPKVYEPDNATPGRWASIAKSHTVADPETFRMQSLMDDPSGADKTVSLSQADLVGTAKALKVSQEFFYDLTSDSVGLLTNTATGGWRKDLSTLTENWAMAPSSNLPFFRALPDRDITFAKPTAANATPLKGMLYPWASYRGGAGDMAIYRQGAVASWENLKEYALMYRNAGMSVSPTGRNRMTAVSTAIDGDPYSFIHRIRVLPVIARIQWVFSYTGVASGDLVEPRIVMTPVITMWNPYNVEVTLPSGTGGQPALGFQVQKPLPVAFRFTMGGAGATAYKSLTAGATNYTQSLSSTPTLSYNIVSGFTLKPGETRVFSPQTSSPVDAAQNLALAPGYRPKGGHYFYMLPGVGGKGGTAPASSKVKTEAIFDTSYLDIKEGVGIYLDMSVGDNVRHLAYRMTYTRDVASAVYAQTPELSSPYLSEIVGRNTPFLSTIFGARMASNTMVAAKGFVQSCPLVNYTAMGNKDEAETTINTHYFGTHHPVNSPFDFSFRAHSNVGDEYLPNSDDTSGRGYIVSGFLKSNGLSRCIIAELPTRPLQSLCELQNWDMRFENPVPPFQFNLIGNSDATPLLPANAVYNSKYSSLSTNLQYDDSYCANHVLFDDWFMSSITPDPDNYGSSGRNMQTTFTDFVTGVKPLPNRAYKPIQADAGEDTSKAVDLYNAKVRTSDGWKSIASRLEVEGMFNVNSTSVTAWRALLGHARKQSVAYYQEAGTTWAVNSSGELDYPYNRFSIAADVQAGKAGSSGAFDEATEYTGYRTFSEQQLDQLAEEIVKQVRLRGPFLSLSEFVNRQLSSGDLALAGAVQSALNELGKKGGNPYAYLQGSKDASASTLPRAGDAEYKFAEAATGKSAYGLPGWIRQADVLRPLAPILSARDDTFIVRSYGDVRDDNGKVVASAVCEAVVRRTRDYVDPADAADLATPPVSEINKTFGRRFEVVSFRWLEPSEI